MNRRRTERAGPRVAQRQAPRQRSTPGGRAGQPQIWVAGDIGITPFQARLHERAATGVTVGDIDFFYCTPQDGDFPEQLPAQSTAA